MAEKPDSEHRTERGVCRALKTKMLYVTGVEPAAGQSSTKQYWCVHTMSAVGPDDALVLPAHCRPARDCYEED